MTGLAWGLKSLARQPIRTGLSLAGIAVAAAMLLDMVMLSGGIDKSFSDLLLRRGFQMRLTPKGTLPFDTEASMAGASEIVAALRRDPAVAAAGAVLAFTLVEPHVKSRRASAAGEAQVAEPTAPLAEGERAAA